MNESENPIFDETVKASQTSQETETQVEHVEADVENPGDEATTHNEDDNPEQYAGDFVDDEEDNS